MKWYLTMIMALFLAILTWIYLFIQGNGPAEIDVQFQPRLDMKDLASGSWEDGEGRKLVPGGSLRVRVLGPKGDVRLLALRPNVFACEARVDPRDLTGLQGTHRLALVREDFNFPGNLVVDPLPYVTIQYAKYLEKEIDLVADRSSCEGVPLPGYEIASIMPNPRRVRARVPADQPGVSRVEIRKVPVGGKSESFTLSSWFLDASASNSKIQLLDPFTVEVKLVLKSHSRKIPADLHVLARPEHLRRIEFESRITIELQGPEDLVHEAAQGAAAFLPYVVVTDKDMEPPGPRNISEIGCHILNPKYQGKISVVLMPDEKPENRQVKIKVLPK
jgi:hypothetical protein